MKVRDYIRLYGIITGLITGVAVFYWGVVYFEPIRLILGVAIAIYCSNYLIRRSKNLKATKQWMQKHEGKIFLFYPSFIEVQRKIRELVNQNTSVELLHIHYENETMMGDVPRYVVIELMEHYNQIKMHHHSVFKFVEGKLIMERIDEYIDQETNDINLAGIISTIERVKNL